MLRSQNFLILRATWEEFLDAPLEELLLHANRPDAALQEFLFHLHTDLIRRCMKSFMQLVDLARSLEKLG